jgi:peptidylprolyl isomerase
MKTHLLALTLLTATAAAQTTTTTHPPVHHTATTGVHRVATAAKPCPVDLTTLSPKIPALPATAPKCPSELYKVSYSLNYTDTLIGTGELAQPKKWYTVHYTGYLPDGTKFDSSLDRKEPISFPYGAHRVIPGWDTGFEGMRIGGKRRLYIPYQLGYGDKGQQAIPPRAELIFDIELLSQSAEEPKPKAPPAPPAPPAPAPKPATPPPAASTPPPPADKPAATPPPADKPTTPPTKQ